MEYSNSAPADPATYPADMDGLCSGIPVRVHRNPELADRGALRAQKEWARLFGSLPSGFSGIMGPQHNLVATVFPEIFPDRLELFAYIAEMMFLVDDAMDRADVPSAVAAPFLADFLQAGRLATEDAGRTGPSSSPVRELLADVSKAMVAIDPVPAADALRWLEQWAGLVTNQPAHREFRDFEEYLEYRRITVSSHAMIGLAIFGMGLNIPEQQQQLCHALSEPAWMAAALANDYHSWEREFDEASGRDQPFVTNALWVLMKQHGMTCNEAQVACRDRAKAYADEYLQVLATLEGRDDLCSDAKLSLRATQFGISGNIAWGLQCPRYHPNRGLTPRQLEMAQAIAMEETTGGFSAPLRAVTEDHVFPQAKKDDVVVVVSAMDHVDVAAVRDLPALGTEALEAPSRYLDSMPSKGIRDKLIDALNRSFCVPPKEIARIKRIMNLLHGASLMLDDIQDSSKLRRGQPTTHLVFGQMLTINSAGYRFLDALSEVRKLGSDQCMDAFCDALRDLYTGQSHDLAWTCNLVCPTEEEYLAMVDGKTGGLFQMLAKMLDALSDSPTKPDPALLTRLISFLGRFFQIRDDYINLTSSDYTKQKGFYEDLDEGKYSLPLIHALGCREGRVAPAVTADQAILLHNMLSQRHVAGRMSLDQKKLFLEQLKLRGSLEYTRDTINILLEEMRGLAGQLGLLQNEMLTGLLDSLRV